MIMRGTTPRKLTGFAFLAVLAAAAVLLPLWPSWGQDKVKRDPTNYQPQQKPDDLKRTAEELGKLKQYLDMLKDDYDKKAAELRNAQQREAAKAKAALAQTGPVTIEQRLADIEKKLDLVLGQVHELQKQFAKKGWAGAYPVPDTKADYYNPAGVRPGYPMKPLDLNPYAPKEKEKPKTPGFGADNPLDPTAPVPSPGAKKFAPNFPGQTSTPPATNDPNEARSAPPLESSPNSDPALRRQ
jgi:hypothetical protein